jgi:hypothetical protein
MLLRRQPRAGGISSLLLLHEAAVLLLLQAGAGRAPRKVGALHDAEAKGSCQTRGPPVQALGDSLGCAPNAAQFGAVRHCTVELFLGMIPAPDTDSQSQRPASSAPKVDSDSNLLPHRRD